MTLREQINQDLLDAMKSGDVASMRALRDIKTAVTRAEKDEGAHTLSEEEYLDVVRKQAKQRKDSILAYEQAGRDDLVGEEKAELLVLERYLPAQMDEHAIRTQAQAIIDQVGATSMRDMGKVMGPLMAELKGQADGRLVNQVVRDLLTNPRDPQ